jgi:hypothetical protein
MNVQCDTSLSDKEKIDAIMGFDNLVLAYKNEVIFNIPLSKLTRYNVQQRNADEAWAYHAVKDMEEVIKNWGEVMVVEFMEEETRNKIFDAIVRSRRESAGVDSGSTPVAG